MFGHNQVHYAFSAITLFRHGPSYKHNVIGIAIADDDVYSDAWTGAQAYAAVSYGTGRRGCSQTATHQQSGQLYVGSPQR